MKDLERRMFHLSDELRVEQRAEGAAVIEGHAAVFGQPTPIWDWTEEVQKGAFREAIAKDDIRALFNHDSNFVIARNRAGTLELREDEVGLFISATPPETQWARDLLVSIRRKDITGMSIGFRTVDDQWTTVAGIPHRTLKKVELFDVSPVTFPAFPQTDVSVALRSLGRWVGLPAPMPGRIQEMLERSAVALADADEAEILFKLRS